MSEALLEAGLLPATAAQGEIIRARAYGHELLGDRQVVRLAGDTVAPGEDGALAFLGFGEPAVSEPVARGRRRGLGYPAWALVHDPAHAKEALSVVKDLERANRRAKTKPGQAIEMFETLASGLPIPHLPSFWEQAGRAFVASGNTRQAAMFFGRAREAEQVYALAVDEELRRTVYLEFAFAGALTVKAIVSYGDELARRYAGERAYAEFTELVVRRSLGGLPPWTELPKQIRTLAAGAGLDPAAEEIGVLDILLPLPATRHAPAGFWKAARPALLRMDSAEARGLLLQTFPSADGMNDWWLDLLAAADAFDLLQEEGAEVAVWFSRMVKHTNRSWRSSGVPARLLALVPVLTPKLIADAVPVKLAGRIDPDLLDLLVAGGVPLELPDEHSYLDLDRWRAREDRRDLAALAADPRFTALLGKSINQYANSHSLDDLVGVAVLRPHIERLTRERIEAITSGGHAHAERALAILEQQVGGATLAAFPEQRAALAAADFAVPLARTLRAGIIDELGWEALDTAALELACKDGLSVTASWPVLTLCGRTKAIAVGPDGRVAEHELRITGKPYGNPTAVFADGQFLVMWWAEREFSAYWSGNPSDVFTPEGHWYAVQRPALGFASLAADGGRVSGGRVLRAGDRKIPNDTHILFDGETHWLQTGGWPGHLQEFDPVTGRLGRRSHPAFLEDQPLADGESWNIVNSSLGVLPEGVTGSPLGQRDRQVGFAVSGPEGYHSRHARTRYTVRGADGRRVEGFFPDIPWGLLTFPGSDEPQVVADFPQVSLLDPKDGSRHWSVGNGRHPGTPVVAPPAFWHFLRPRDPAGSAVLRAISEDSARELLEAYSPDSELSLPGLTDQRLRDCTGMFVKLTADLVLRRDLMLKQVAPAGSDRHAVDEDDFEPAVSGIVKTVSSRGTSRTLQDLEVVSRFLAGEIDAATALASKAYGSIDWTPLLGQIGSAALRAASPATSAEHRVLLQALLEVWAGSPFADRAVRVQTGVARVTEEDIVKVSAGGSTIGMTGPLWNDLRNKQRNCSFVAVGDAPPSLGETVQSTEVPHGWGDAAQLARFAELLTAGGTYDWDPAAARSLAEQTGLSTAAASLLLAGLPTEGRSWRPLVGTHARTALGLKAKEAEGAVNELSDLDIPTRAALLSSAMPDDPADLWAEGGLGRAADRLAQAWISRFGKRVSVPETTLATVSALMPNLQSAYLCGQLLAPDQTLTEDVATWLVKTDRGHAINPEPGGKSLNFQLDNLVILIPWLYAMLPAGDPVRAAAPRALELLLARLSAPDLLLKARYWSGHQGESDVIRNTFGDRPYRGKDPAVTGVIDDGLTVVDHNYNLYYRPAMFGDDVRSQLLESCVGGMAPLHAVRSAGFAAIAARISGADLPDGAYEADPRASVPELVAAVRGHLGLEEDPATLYLQLLTLLEPTDRNLRLWNGWTPARHKKAVAVLAERGLVLAAKRARAGRGVFLPGGWAEATSPDLPLETWKLPLYDLSLPAVGRYAGGPLRRFLPLRPLTELFAAAWQRVLDGDGPR